MAWGWAEVGQLGSPKPAESPTHLEARVPSAACHETCTQDGQPAVLLSTQHTGLLPAKGTWALPCIAHGRPTCTRSSESQVDFLGYHRKLCPLQIAVVEPHGLCVLSPAELMLVNINGERWPPVLGVDASEWHTIIACKPNALKEGPQCPRSCARWEAGQFQAEEPPRPGTAP